MSHLRSARLHSTCTSMNRSDDWSCRIVVAQPKGMSSPHLLLYLVAPLPLQVGEWRVLFIYALLAIGLELVVWFVPYLIGDAVSVSIIGVLLGPMYPITMNHAGRVLPAWLLTGNVPRLVESLQKEPSAY